MSDAALALDALDSALDAEREALLASDIVQLTDANKAKLEALTQIEKSPLGPELGDRVNRIVEKNALNQTLLTRRRREVRWALSTLGVADMDGTYGPDGNKRQTMQPRYLGEG